jgi:hypothetical protein
LAELANLHFKLFQSPLDVSRFPAAFSFLRVSYNSCRARRDDVSRFPAAFSFRGRLIGRPFRRRDLRQRSAGCRSEHQDQQGRRA